MDRGRHRWASAASLAPVVTLLLLVGCSKDETPQVQVASVGRADVAEVVEAPGAVAAKAAATVTAPADGSVERLEVRDGQKVKAGQVLLRVDSPAARRQLRQAERADAQAADAGRVTLPGVDLSLQQRQADAAATKSFRSAREAAAAIPDADARARALAGVASAEAQYATARTSAQTAVRRFNTGLGSLAQALSSLSQAQRVQTRAAVDAARRRVDALVVRAPIGGTVSFGGGSGAAPGSGGAGGGDLSGALDQLPESAQGQARQLLGGGGSGAGVQGSLTTDSPVTSGAALLAVTDVSSLTVTANVDETDVLLVKKGVASTVELDAVPGARYEGQVTAVDLAPTTSSRGGVSYVVRVSLDRGTGDDGDPAPRPRPGMSAVVDLKVRTARKAVAVPAAAVFRDGTRDAVWVVDRGVAHKRQVLLGAQGQDVVQVREGVRVGDSVVVRGADRVTDGQRVAA